MNNLDSFIGDSDSDKIENAIKACKNGEFMLPSRAEIVKDGRDYWLLDRAVLIPENTTILLHNCKIKLSDNCRDNFFRSANCGLGINNPEIIRNIHIKGEGLCVLEGADHPRSTGDSSKVLAFPCPKRPEDLCRLADWVAAERKSLGKTSFWDEHSHSYGTDAGKKGESQRGDWRNIGILFANAENWSIENLRLVDFHGWGISLEACAYGSIKNIDFDACMAKEIDGLLHNIENQDGIDLRNGCHDIMISDITGGTGDDLIALTAIAGPEEYLPGGSLGSTHVLHNDWTRRDKNIHNVLIRNVKGYSKGGICFHIRLLAVETKIWNVVIDGVIDTSPEGFYSGGVLLLGEQDGAYGSNRPDSISRITVSNMLCDSSNAILVNGYVANSVISNVMNNNPAASAIRVCREGGLKNVVLNGICTVGEKIIDEDF